MTEKNVCKYRWGLKMWGNQQLECGQRWQLIYSYSWNCLGQTLTQMSVVKESVHPKFQYTRVADIPCSQRNLSIHLEASIMHPIFQTTSYIPSISISTFCFFVSFGFYIYLSRNSRKLMWGFLCPCLCQALALPVKVSYFLSGKGCVYTYDAVGSYEGVGYSFQSNGQQLLMPALDNQLQ